MTIAEPTTRRFTRDEYYRMGELGFFDGQRVELIQGEIITMSPQNTPHALACAIITSWLVKSLGGEFTVRCQLPLVASEDTEPEPDFVVLAGSPESQRDHPTTALLVIELADTTLRHDRRKADLYASRKVPEYWILNLQKRQLEVYRNPQNDAASSFGSCYAERATLEAQDIIHPATLPLAPVPVSRLLPQAG